MKKHLDENNIFDKLFLLSEYKYYTGLNEAPEDEEESPEDDIEAGDDLEDIEGDPMEDELDVPEDEGGEDLEDDLAGDIEGTLDDMGMEDDAEMGGVEEDEVEIDVSEIVDGVNQNANSINDVSTKMDSMSSQVNSYINQLMKSNQTLTQQIQQMGQNIEQEFKKRAPTPYEDIHMRSLSSYPYNQKLTDYFKPAKGDEYGYSIDNPAEERADYQIKVKPDDEDETPKEYVLTNQDIEDGFNDIDIRDSL